MAFSRLFAPMSFSQAAAVSSNELLRVVGDLRR
jgi:hypothetical protein